MHLITPRRSLNPLVPTFEDIPFENVKEYLTLMIPVYELKFQPMRMSDDLQKEDEEDEDQDEDDDDKVDDDEDGIEQFL